MSAQLLVDDEEPLPRLDKGQRDKSGRGRDLCQQQPPPSLPEREGRAEHVQQVGTAHTCCKARNTHIAMEHQVGSYHWDYLMIMGNISPVLSYHIVSIYSWNNSFSSCCK